MRRIIPFATDEVTAMHRSGDAAQGLFIPSCFFLPFRLGGSKKQIAQAIFSFKRQ
jgi:hypothetical protein